MEKWRFLLDMKKKLNKYLKRENKNKNKTKKQPIQECAHNYMFCLFKLYAKNRADDSQPDQRILYVYAMINIFLHGKQSKSLWTLLVCFCITWHQSTDGRVSYHGDRR